MFVLDKNIVIAVDNHLFVISFSTGSETGLAVVTAPTERRAIDVLKHTGRYNGYPDAYKILESRNMGLTTCLRTELFLESYVNSAVVFDALSRIAPKEGPRGPEGPDGPSAYEVAVKNGFIGSETDWLISLKASITAGDISRILGYAPVSPAQLDGKVDKLPGKGLSTNDLTDERLAWLDRAQQFYRLSAGETFSDIQNPRYGDICQTTVQDVIPFDNTSSHVTLTVTDPPLYITCLWPSDIGGLMPSDSGWSVTYNDPDTMSIEFWNIPGGGDLFTRAGTYELYRGTGCPDLLLHRGFVDKLFQYTMGGWVAYPGTLADLTDDSSHRLVTDTQIASWNAKYEKPVGGIPASDLAADALPTGVYTIPITVTEGGWEVDPSITYATVSEAISDGKILAIEPNGDGRVLADYEVQNGTINVFGSFSQMDVIGQLFVSFTDGETPEADFTSVPVPDSLSDLTDDANHRTVTDTEKETWNGKYTKPSGGIPSTDMSSDVQTSLGKADTALQSFTETDPTVPSWAKAQNPPTEIFWAAYGTTTYSEVIAAYDNGKLVCVSDGDENDPIGILYWYDSSSAYFIGHASGGTKLMYYVRSSNDTWLTSSYELYQKPAGGIPTSDLAPGVIPTVESMTAQEVTTAVNTAWENVMS